jgi:DNA-binding CsgD family transcriptional regulator
MLDAFYDVDRERDAWFAGVLDAVTPLLAGDCGLGGLLYSTDDAGLHLEKLDGRGLSNDWLRAGVDIYSDPRLVKPIADTYRGILCEPLNGVLSERRVLSHVSDRPTIGGQIVMNGGGAAFGSACALHLFSRDAATLSTTRRALLSQLTVHLAAAYRLQRRLAAARDAGAAVHAVLTPRGRVEHAEADAATPHMREALARAVQDREGARRPTASDAPARPLRGRPGLVAARWTLVDEYLHAGRRYVLARHNEPDVRGPETLSPRERQVATLAAGGRSNKVIAYELGLAHSTVRVLMARACAKLAARTRGELVERLAAS